MAALAFAFFFLTVARTVITSFISFDDSYGGEDRIRTYDPLARITVFETAAFDHSATSP